jgi:AcrR family transcriptional regulator
MGKHFSDEEKQFIKKRLLSEGKKLFETYGVKKTSVDKIVEKVNIAKGSFYNFYSSKESMVFELIMDIEIKLHREEMKQFYKFLEECEFTEALKRTVWKSIDFIREEPLLLINNDPQLIYEIWSKISEQEKVRSAQQDQDRITDFIAVANTIGYKLTVPTTVLNATLMSFFLIYVNQEMVRESGIEALELIMRSTLEKIFVKCDD